MDNCALCGTNVRTLFKAHNEEEYCIDCIRIKFPPYLLLMQYSSGPLYNIETGKYESFRDPKELELCGWEVRMLLDFPNGTIMFYLEYHGDVKCGRCEDYEWGLPGGYCMSQACTDHAKKKQPQERYYPIYKSLFLEWKYGGKLK